MIEFLVREMNEEDLDKILEIYQQGMNTQIATFQTECPSKDEWKAGHLQDCRYVAIAQGEVLGWVALSPTSKRKVYAGVVEISIYIADHAKGNGVGSKLMETLIFESEKKGYWSLYASIIEENIASLRLHEKCGFRRIGYREKIAKDKANVWHNTILMERRSTIL